MSLRVLVADDEPAIVRAVTRMLERSGHSVRSAGTAQQALDLLEEGGFDVALVDDHMPGGGRSVLDALAARDDFDGRMFLMSGALPDDANPLPEGAAHLQKPFQYDDLLRRVEGR